MSETGVTGNVPSDCGTQIFLILFYFLDMQQVVLFCHVLPEKCHLVTGSNNCERLRCGLTKGSPSPHSTSSFSPHSHSHRKQHSGFPSGPGTSPVGSPTRT